MSDPVALFFVAVLEWKAACGRGAPAVTEAASRIRHAWASCTREQHEEIQRRQRAFFRRLREMAAPG